MLVRPSDSQAALCRGLEGAERQQPLGQQARSPAAPARSRDGPAGRMQFPAQALPMPADAPVTSARLAPSLMGAPISHPAPPARRGEPATGSYGTTPS